MPSLNLILNRFMRLLPFLTVLSSFRRFHYELFHPYPDVWGDAQCQPGSTPAQGARPGSGPGNLNRRPMPRQIPENQICGYVGWHELYFPHGGRREPFC